MADEAKVGEAVAFLQKTSSTTGQSVYDQLAAVVGKILAEKPAEAVDLLEVSLLAKKTAYNPASLSPAIPTPEAAAAATAKAELFTTPVPETDPETGAVVEAVPPNDHESENVVTAAALFKQVGVGLGDTESYEVMLAMKKLGESPDEALESVRFFGKFFGTSADYFVFEATPKTVAPAEELPEGFAGTPPEAPGSGANSHVYYVCQTLGGPFTKLPDVTPDMITTARAIKKYLTGDLAAEVSAYPLFPGQEAAYLRATIARIASATVVCPTGFFELGGEGEETKLNRAEAFAPPEDASALASWGHRYQHIKAQGRCEAYVPPPPEGEEEAAPAEPEVSPALLTTLDAPWLEAGDAESDEPTWAPLKSSSMAAVKYQVAGVKSLVWPGAYAVASGEVFSNVYVGYGIKNAPFVPMPPPPVCQEFEGEVLESSELPERPEAPEEEAAAEEA